jgi:predicted outer membrane lipoprotein
MMRRNYDMFDVAMWLGGILVALFVIGGIAFGVINATHVEHHTCTVESKDRTTTSGGSSDARLYTTDCGVLNVGDSILSWHFRSADTYASVKAGKTYRVTTRGYRIGFLSMFPNVVEAAEVVR